MKIIILAEYDNKKIKESTSKAIKAALTFDGEIDLLVAGKNITQIAQDGAQYSGINKIIMADSDCFDHSPAEAISELILQLAPNYDVIIAAATSSGKNILPRVAAMLDVEIIANVTKIISSDIFERPIYAGNAIQTVKSKDNKKVITIQTTAFEEAKKTGKAEIKIFDAPQFELQTHFIDEETTNSERPDLNNAKIIISGGIAFGSREKFIEMLEPLAKKLNAAIGTTRAAAEAGFAPNEWQVGQTGRIVAPELYIAFGISGAIQHIAGMKDSRIIVAINKDPEAPIFKIADYGLVMDIFEAIPAFEKAL